MTSPDGQMKQWNPADVMVLDKDSGPFEYGPQNQSYYLASEADALIAKLREELTAARADAQRYRWLRDSQPNSLHLTRNGDHACNYMTAGEWIDAYPDLFTDESPEEIQRMRAANTIWTLQIYPDTPIGSYVWNAATLDAVIDSALSATEGKGETPHERAAEVWKNHWPTIRKDAPK